VKGAAHGIGAVLTVVANRNFLACERLAGAIHAIEEFEKSLIRYLREDFANSIAEQLAMSHELSILIVRKVEDMLGARQRADESRGLHHQVRNARCLLRGKAVSECGCRCPRGACTGLMPGVRRSRFCMLRRTRCASRLSQRLDHLLQVIQRHRLCKERIEAGLHGMIDLLSSISGDGDCGQLRPFRSLA
jgi:hypothetical protein